MATAPEECGKKWPTRAILPHDSTRGVRCTRMRHTGRGRISPGVGLTASRGSVYYVYDTPVGYRPLSRQASHPGGFDMAGAYVEVTDQAFREKVLDSQEPVVVDFWAPWCRPCLMMAPTFEALSSEYQGKITFAKLNTDENMDTPGRYGIQGIPTMLIFRGGKEV